MRPRPSSTRQTRLSARPTAPNAPEAPISDSARPMTSAVIDLRRSPELPESYDGPPLPAKVPADSS